MTDNGKKWGSTGAKQMAGQSNDESDFAQRTTIFLEKYVGALRDKSTRPILLAAKALVAGVIGLAVVSVAIVVTVIGLQRLLDNLVFSQRVWATDMVIGGMFFAAGVFLLIRAKKEPVHVDD